MVEKPKSLHVLGLELIDHEIKGVKLSQRHGRIVLDRFFSININSEQPQTEKTDEIDIKPLSPEPTEITLQQLGKHYLLATALPTTDVLVRALDVSLTKIGDIDAVLPFQAEPLLPYPVENALLDRIILSQSKEGTQLTLLATRKERVQAHIDRWKNLTVDPEGITCTPAALAQFCQFVAPSANPSYVIHLSKHQIFCCLIIENKLIASQLCSIQLKTLDEALDKDHKDNKPAVIEWGHLNRSSHPALFASLSQLQQELTRILFSLGKHNKEGQVNTILFTGDVEKYPQLSNHLAKILHKEITIPAIPASFDMSMADLLKFSLPIGTALTYLPKNKVDLNFRQGDFAYPDPWKRLKKPLSIYFGLCLLLAFAVYLFGIARLKNKEDDIRDNYNQLLTVIQKPHSEHEKALNPHLSSDPLTLKELSIEELQIRVNALEKELSSTPDTYPLLPNIMTVSDVLAWLNSLPTVVEKDFKTGHLKPLIQIENFTYSMVKRPEISKKNERYQVKIELEFSSQTPKEAREFHDALIAPNTVIDPKGEVKWSTNRGKYRASFFLKDKTIYLPHP